MLPDKSKLMKFRSMKLRQLVLLACMFFSAIAYGIENPRAWHVTISADKARINPSDWRLSLRIYDAAGLQDSIPLNAHDLVRAEIFDPITGEIVVAQQVAGPAAGAELGVEFNNDPAIQLLQLAGESPDGSLQILDSISMPVLREQGTSGAWTLTPASTVPYPAMLPLDNISLSTLLDNGPIENRIDIILVGDGYTADEMGKWESDAEAVHTFFLAEPPYSDYTNYFNVHRLDVASAESGASHPELGIEKDTAFSSYYNCASIQRLICTDTLTVLETVNRHTEFLQRDIIVVIVNDPEYGGSGGSVAVASTHMLSTELVLHETGHSFGQLADEYDDPLPTTADDCGVSSPTFEPNVSHLVDYDELKWKHWVEPATPLPSEAPVWSSEPGLYAGSKYCNDLYRPTPSSKMRVLNRPFDAINEEALVRRIYDYVSPIDAYYPASQVVATTLGAPELFTIDIQQPDNHQLDILWTIDGQPVATGTSFSSLLLTPGEHIVSVQVDDPTLKVRRDPGRKLRSEVTWQVFNSVNPEAPPSYGGDIISIPFVRVAADQSLYKVELKLYSLEQAQFVLYAAQKLNDTLTPEHEAIFENNQLEIDGIEVGGVPYNVVMDLVTEEDVLIFQVSSVQPAQ